MPVLVVALVFIIIFGLTIEQCDYLIFAHADISEKRAQRLLKTPLVHRTHFFPIQSLFHSRRLLLRQIHTLCVPYSTERSTRPRTPNCWHSYRLRVPYALKRAYKHLLEIYVPNKPNKFIAPFPLKWFWWTLLIFLQGLWATFWFFLFGWVEFVFRLLLFLATVECYPKYSRYVSVDGSRAPLVLIQKCFHLYFSLNN